MNDFLDDAPLTAVVAGGDAPSRASAHFRIYADTHRADTHWRLLSGNHRELGRAARRTVTVEEAAADIAATVRRLSGAEVLVRPHVERRWEWRLVDAEGVVAVSGHAFDRKLRCVQAVEQFLAVAPTAVVAAHVITSGSRRGARPFRGVLGTA